MIKLILLFAVVFQLSLVEAGHWSWGPWGRWRRRRPRPTPAPVCNEWCFSSTSCMVPGNNTCTRCLAGACGFDFADPFSTKFGLDCINNAVLGTSGACTASCPSWTSARSDACKDCLKPCIKIAKKESGTFCPYDYFGDRDNCAPCVSNTTCPSEDELFDGAPQFCRDYIKISCGEFPYQLLDRNLNPWNVTCVRSAWEDSCSQCPAFNVTRWVLCGECLDNCKASTECTINCESRTTYPVSNIECSHCKALCAANTNAGANCTMTNCPDCATCNNCIASCENQQFIENNCECVENDDWW